MQTAISFVRHGEVYNPDNIFYGRLSGFRLSDNGNYQAVQAAETLNGSQLAAIFSSPLLRARQTAGELVKSNPHLRYENDIPMVNRHSRVAVRWR